MDDRRQALYSNFFLNFTFFETKVIFLLKKKEFRNGSLSFDLPHTHSNAHTHTHTHTHSYAHTHTHSHTHTHTILECSV